MIDLSQFDLTYSFDKNLREVLNCRADAESACRELQSAIESDTDIDSKARLLAKLGVYIRMLGGVEESARYLSESLQLLEHNGAPLVRLIAARLRLAHVFQWQQCFPECNQLFISCIEESKTLNDQGEMLSFALQHQGKNLFDQKEYDAALKCFYDSMMIRVRLGKHDLADSSRLALDRTVEIIVPAPPDQLVERLLADPRLPKFVPYVYGQRHSEGSLPRERSNCINAVINFFAKPYKYETVSTTDALTYLKNEFTQFEQPPQFSDVVVFWSRSGGSWAQRKIRVSEMNPGDSDFPYGLVFEHMAVFIDEEIIFHKPSPAIEVPYKIDYFQASMTALKYSSGFEMTFHRRNIVQ